MGETKSTSKRSMLVGPKRWAKACWISWLSEGPTLPSWSISPWPRDSVRMRKALVFQGLDDGVAVAQLLQLLSHCRYCNFSTCQPVAVGGVDEADLNGRATGELDGRC